MGVAADIRRDLGDRVRLGGGTGSEPIGSNLPGILSLCTLDRGSGAGLSGVPLL